jgi:RNA polymerase sigma-70 factor, ECF subfamily
VNDDDRRLIADCLGGRRDAFGELVTRYQARLYNAALRLVPTAEDAADVVQDAFLNAYQSLHSFKGDAEFFTWLYRIAFNTAISLKPTDESEYVKPGIALERTEDERQLNDAIARLSQEHRDVLLMKDIEGMKYEDIAEVLRVPIGTIRSRLHRARLELRDLLVPFEDRGTDEQAVSNERDEADDRDVTDTPTNSPGGATKKTDAEHPTPARRARRAE